MRPSHSGPSYSAAWVVRVLIRSYFLPLAFVWRWLCTSRAVPCGGWEVQQTLEAWAPRWPSMTDVESCQNGAGGTYTMPYPWDGCVRRWPGVAQAGLVAGFMTLQVATRRRAATTTRGPRQ